MQIDPNRQILDCSYQNIKSLLIKQQYPNILAIILTGNQIEDLAFTSYFPNLQLLCIDFCALDNFFGLYNLQHLKYIIARGNNIADLAYLPDLPSLECLDLGNNTQIIKYINKQINTIIFSRMKIDCLQLFEKIHLKETVNLAHNGTIQINGVIVYSQIDQNYLYLKTSDEVEINYSIFDVVESSHIKQIQNGNSCEISVKLNLENLQQYPTDKFLQPQHKYLIQDAENQIQYAKHYKIILIEYKHEYGLICVHNNTFIDFEEQISNTQLNDQALLSTVRLNNTQPRISDQLFTQPLKKVNWFASKYSISKIIKLVQQHLQSYVQTTLSIQRTYELIQIAIRQYNRETGSPKILSVLIDQMTIPINIEYEQVAFSTHLEVDNTFFQKLIYVQINDNYIITEPVQAHSQPTSILLNVDQGICFADMKNQQLTLKHNIYQFYLNKQLIYEGENNYVHVSTSGLYQCVVDDIRSNVINVIYE
ncbi:Leucine-rich_repeat domain superfamily [Hexamita inflata]|uniref:Leucine-rich repeat domain superfamily n=1 Tax=Hexamita inflata TaxID=28002 RepID=A0AA86RIM0_9EUKA|nr:Leucine-rich repeat domain superfamily [Hexamita inflata]